jgi:hypothetical protein
MKIEFLSPNGATYASPGQRPGFRRNQHRALKGRHKTSARSTRVVPPLQGSESRVAGDPGRCPGLACGRPLALKMKIGGGFFSPNGATYLSPGQRPGFRRNQHRALKGRHKTSARSTRVVAPLQGSELRVAGDPGRCPGLACGRPLALKMKIGGGR